MTAPEIAVPAGQETPAGEHPYEFPPVQPLRLAGHVGGRIISERPEWAYLADPPAPGATEAVLAEWRAALVRNLPVRRVVPAEPEPAVPVPAPLPVVPPSARLAALPEPAPTPAHAGSRRPLFGRRRHDGDRLDEMAGEFAEPAEREHAGIWPRPGQDGPGPSEPVPPPAEEVMPHAARSRAPEAHTNAPRPGQDAEGDTGPSITGPGCQDARSEMTQDEGRAFGGLNHAHEDVAAEAEDDAAAAAVQHAAEEALRRAGAKQKDLDELAKPGDGRDATAEMTAIIERPQEQQ